MYKITGVGGQGQSPATMSSLWKQIPTVQKADLFFEHLKVGVLWQKDIEYIFQPYNIPLPFKPIG